MPKNDNVFRLKCDDEVLTVAPDGLTIRVTPPHHGLNPQHPLASRETRQPRHPRHNRWSA
jgi:hypothetical protein